LSVVGCLEDLSFPDILQMIHLSRQSGTLILTQGDAERRVRFRNGRVCGATLGRGDLELEDLLLQKGMVTQAALQSARERQEKTGEPISSVLVSLGAISQETIDRVVREELGTILRSLVVLQEGDFRFELSAPASKNAGPGIEVPEGLEPASILREPALPDAPGASGRPRSVPARVRGPRRVLLVVERSYLRLALRDDLLQHGWEVNGCSATDSARDLARGLAERGTPFHLVCDLFLPDASGTGWGGGLELVKEMRTLVPALGAILIGEIRDSRRVEEIRSAGSADYVPLPDISAVGHAAVGEALGEFCAAVRETLRGRRPAYRPERSNAGAIRVGDPLSLLRGLIGEMRGEQQAEIPLLVLRLAGEYFERGSLFMIVDREAHGVGGFGTDEPGGHDGMDRRVRGSAVPIPPGSVLARVIESTEAIVGAIPRTPENAPLLERVGSPQPSEAALLPLLSGQKIIGVLYGDNAGKGRPLGDLKALEIFLSQAGFALENAFLQRQVDSLSRAGQRGEPNAGQGSAGRMRA
jgi:DNA-binding NarL/FixJ family response regulator